MQASSSYPTDLHGYFVGIPQGQMYLLGHRQLLADSVEKVGLAAARRSDLPAVEVAASHFRLPFGVSAERPCSGLRVNLRVSALSRRTYPVSGGP